jgi:hypothetical protein
MAMAFEESSKFCKRCGRQVLVRRQSTNHILHLLLTLVTMGFWIPIWILCSVRIGGWRCTVCGTSAGRNEIFVVLGLLFLIIICGWLTCSPDDKKEGGSYISPPAEVITENRGLPKEKKLFSTEQITVAAWEYAKEVAARSRGATRTAWEDVACIPIDPNNGSWKITGLTYADDDKGEPSPIKWAVYVTEAYDAIILSSFVFDSKIIQTEKIKLVEVPKQKEVQRNVPRYGHTVLKTAFWGVHLGEPISNLDATYSAPAEDVDDPSVRWTLREKFDGVKALHVNTFNGYVYMLVVEFEDTSEQNLRAIIRGLEDKYGARDPRKHLREFHEDVMGQAFFAPVIDREQILILVDRNMGILNSDTLRLAYCHDTLMEKNNGVRDKRKAQRLTGL